MFLKLTLILSVLTVFVTVPQAEGATDKVVCYFGSWARTWFRAGKDGFLDWFDEYNDVQMNTVKQVSDLKSANPDLKVLFSIGGLWAGRDNFPSILASAEYRSNLIRECISVFEEFNYDGVDVDWEFPEDNEMDNYNRLLQEMRAAFNQNGYILLVTVPYSPTPDAITIGTYNVPEISRSVDLINVLAYNLFEVNTVSHKSALYGYTSVDSSVSAWLDKGADPNKLIFSIPFDGRNFSLEDPGNTNVGAAAETRLLHLPYNELCSNPSKGYTTVWDDQAQVPYMYYWYDWISYDDERSVTAKVEYAKSKGIAGVAAYSIETDDFQGTCGSANILLQTINKVLYS